MTVAYQYSLLTWSVRIEGVFCESLRSNANNQRWYKSIFLDTGKFLLPPEPVNVFLLCPCMAPLSKFNIQFHNTTVQILLQFDRGKFPHHTINLEISTKLTKNVLKQSTVFNLVFNSNSYNDLAHRRSRFDFWYLMVSWKVWKRTQHRKWTLVVGAKTRFLFGTVCFVKITNPGGNRLYTAPCEIRTKWPSVRRTPV